MSSLFNADFRMLEAALAARERLQTTIAANIANADTPHYRADTRTFEDFLLAARRRQSGGDAEEVSASVVKPLTLGMRRQSHGRQQLDGNTVNMQKEMVRLAENQLMHELTVRLLRGRLNSLANAIKEGGR